MKITLIVAAAVLGAATFVCGQANTRVAVPGAKDPSEVIAAETSKADAVLIAPVKAYFKIDEPVQVRFLVPADQAAASKLIAAFGNDAAKLDGAFANAKFETVIGDGPLFKAYDLVTQKPLTPAKGVKAKEMMDGSIDVAAYYPDLKNPGTYVLTWKNATPLVINHLYSPGRRKIDFEAQKDEISQLPEAKRAMVMAIFSPTVIHATPLEYAVISTSAGDMKATFAYDIAPHTIDNYIALAKDKFYDGTTFHRVIKGFMIQGGDSLGTTDRAGTGGPGYEINAEFTGKQHVRGVLSMARSQDPNSAGSQFFVIHAPAPHLDHKYSAFGQLTAGLDVLDKIAETPVSDNNGAVKGERPRINSIRILPATAEMYGLK